MKANKKDDKLYKKFKRQYKLIFSNKDFIDCAKSSFDRKYGLVAFILSLLENQIGSEKLLLSLQKNKNEWLNLFASLYKDENINKAYEILSLNPIVDFDKIVGCFDCFDNAISIITNFIEYKNINIDIGFKYFKKILKSGFGFILYNAIDCKINYSFEQILTDNEYDAKILMILNNTKLFALVKDAIVESCGNKINNLITLLLGISNDLSYDK